MAFVRIQHPDIEGTATVSERALASYEAKGWERAPAEQPPRPQKNDKTDAWRKYAIARGLPPEQAEAMSRDGDDGLIAYIDDLNHPQET